MSDHLTNLLYECCTESTVSAPIIENEKYTDADIMELIDYLLLHPNSVNFIWVSYNQLTDETGLKIAQIIAKSNTVTVLDLHSNQFGDATYLALADALQINTSISGLYMDENRAQDKNRIDAAFVNTLRINPHRPFDSAWELYDSWCPYSDGHPDFDRLKEKANELGHPTLQSLLASNRLKID